MTTVSERAHRAPATLRACAAPPVRVGLVGEDSLVRSGLGVLLAPYADRVMLVEGALQPGDVDLLLVDLGVAMGDPETLGRLRGSGFRQVATFGWGELSVHHRQLAGAGVRGHLALHLGAEDLVEELERLVLEHDLDQVVDGGTATESPLMALGLTAREAEVMTLVARGLTNLEIADQLYLGINTIKTYIRTAYRKAEVTRRSQAVAWAISHGA